MPGPSYVLDMDISARSDISFFSFALFPFGSEFLSGRDIPLAPATFHSAHLS